MKLLALGDLHGMKPKFYFKDFDYILAPGDFCNSSVTMKYMFQALKYRLEHPNSNKQWYDITGRRVARKIMNESLRKGREVLEALNNAGKPVYVIPGNHDFTPKENSDWNPLKVNHYLKLIKGLNNVVNVHLMLKDVGEFQIIGYGESSGPELPMYDEDKKRLTSDELKAKKRAYSRLKKELSNLFRKASKPVILLNHNVPFNTKIDKINNKASPRNGQHFGSIIVRELIERYEPVLSVGGHMHEHHAKVKIGRTVCVNAGYGNKVNTLITINGSSVSVKFKD